MEQSISTSEKNTFFFKLPDVEGKLFSILIPVIILLIFAGLVFGLYFDSLESPFIFDDINKIERNTHIRLTQFSPKEIVSAGLKSSKTRFIAFISFALNYYFHQYDPFGYHIFNNIVHILTGFFLYLFLAATLKTPSLSSRFDHPDLIAFLAALIWLIHPVQTQSVTYIVQRMNSLASMFFIISFWCYVRARGVESGKARWLWFAGSILAWLLSLGCKQITVTLPLLVFLYEWFFFQDLDKRWLKRRLPYVLGILVLLGFLALAYTGFDPLEKLNKFRDYRENQFTISQRSLTQTRVVMHYISLLIFPHPSRLNLDYDFALSYSLINPLTTLLSLSAIIGLIILGIYLAKKNRLISFCIFWFFGNLVIESSIVPLALIFEHRLYLPSMLVFLIPISLGHRYIKLPWLRAALLCLAVVVLCAWTYQRNRVWQSDLTLWNDVVKKSPNKVRPHLNLGKIFSELGKTDIAIKHYTEALRINPKYKIAHYHLGNAKILQGKLNEAIKHFSEALQIDPAFAEAYSKLGFVLAKQGKTNEAIKHYQKALEIKPYYVPAHLNLGVALSEEGRTAEAINHFNIALEIDPDFADAHYNLAIALETQGKTDEAINHYLSAIKADPANAKTHYNLGNILPKQGRTDEAIAHFNKAISIQPDFTQSLSNLALLYAADKKYYKALVALKKVVAIQPENSSACYNIAALYALQDNVEESLAWLKQAIDKGYQNWELIKTDKDLENIRSSAAYQDLVKNH